MQYSPTPSIERDIAVNQLCSAVVPLLFAYVGLMCVFGEKLANYLLLSDNYQRKNIKPRVYGVAQFCIIGTFMVLVIVYFSWHKIWSIVTFFGVALLAYTCVKCNVYQTKIEYTNSRMHVCWQNKTTSIPFSDISKMNWETRRGSIMFSLVIYCYSGTIIRLSSSDFVGLKKLKSTYDSRTGE